MVSHSAIVTAHVRLNFFPTLFIYFRREVGKNGWENCQPVKVLKKKNRTKKTTEEEVKLLKFDVLTFKLDFSAIYSNIFKHFT